MFVKLSAPRPSAPMEYVPPVNCSVSTPVHTFMSSSPVVMLPRASATKVPTRPKKLPDPAHSSVPVMENAYCPDRLALENFAGGGVGPGPGSDPDPLPPHAAARNPATTETNKASGFTFAVIEASLAERVAGAQFVAMPATWLLPAESR